MMPNDHPGLYDDEDPFQLPDEEYVNDIEGVGEPHGGIRSHRDLFVWRKAIALTTTIYHETGRWSDREKFGLISQIRRSAVSIAANIAEGHGRGSRAVFRNFLFNARGSYTETDTHLVIANEIGIIPGEDALHRYRALDAQTAEVGRLLNRLITALSKSDGDNG